MKINLLSKNTRKIKTNSFTFLFICGALASACSREQKFDSQTAESPTSVSSSDASNDPAAGAGGDSNGLPGGESGSITGDLLGKSGANSESNQGEIVGELLTLPKDLQSFAFEIDQSALSDCQASTPLKTRVNPPDSVKSIDWTSSDSNIVQINKDGTATQVGYGSVTIVAVLTKTDGSKLQDSIDFELLPPVSGLVVSNAKPIISLVTASATKPLKPGGAYSNVKNGTAQGRIRITHPKQNISVSKVTAPIHSTDFADFVFDDITPPTLSKSTCLWTVEFNLKFQYFYVGEITQYKDQRIEIQFAAETERPNFGFPMSATLAPEERVAGSSNVPVFIGSGTEGFSPVK